jgi:hypothetical protein
LFNIVRFRVVVGADPYRFESKFEQTYKSQFIILLRKNIVKFCFYA